MLLVDGAKGIEPQTRKLFAVARLRGLPVFTFVNKMDRCGGERGWGGGSKQGGEGKGRRRRQGRCAQEWPAAVSWAE